MDWLDKTLDDYKEKERQRKTKTEEDKKRLEADLQHKRQQASTALATIYTCFVKVKKQLKSKKYPCEAKSGSYTDAHTGNQFNSDAILIIRNKPLSFGAELSKTNSPYISFSESHGSDDLILEINTTESQQSPTKQNVRIDEVTKEYLEGQIENFVKTVFN